MYHPPVAIQIKTQSMRYNTEWYHDMRWKQVLQGCWHINIYQNIRTLSLFRPCPVSWLIWALWQLPVLWCGRWEQLGASGPCRTVSCRSDWSVLSPLHTSPDLTTPLQTNMELSYCSTSSSNCSSLAGYSSEKPTEVFWRQYKRGRKSLSLWRLLKLVFSKQEQRKTQHVNRSDSLHRFYEELYQREHSRLQSTLIREANSPILDISCSQYYQQEEEEEEEEENIYYLPFC